MPGRRSPSLSIRFTSMLWKPSSLEPSQRLENLLRLLVGHEAQVEFGVGRVRQNGLGAGAVVAGLYAEYVCRGRETGGT